MLISRLVIIIVSNNILLSNWLHSIHCPTGAVCQRSDPSFNKCVAEKLNDLRVTVAKGKDFTNRSGTKIGNWRLITSCDQLVPTPYSVVTFCLFAINSVGWRQHFYCCCYDNLGTPYESQVAYFHASFYSKKCLRSWKNHDF